MTTQSPATPPENFYDIEVTLNNGAETTMADWQGHLLLIVNTASECGLTPQYEGLQKLFEDYAHRGLFVIGMPCNQFGNQEPGTDEEIAEFCTTNFGIGFPLLAKGDVNGDNAHPLFTFLKRHSGGADVEWNFEKFLVSENGEVLGRFAPKTELDDDELLDLVEENLPI
ncbi:glutathione peroxidase [Corynebacterium sp. 13CS0277]|uniref:glutathione peroxidase n=1 Tax=Corynebacterium sp. 13CS0277 TaxID=2071994 RepID=UPI000D02B937|nr:glutathione peroxidase [Corynebacterium sp. 13CS0277]PRQ11252.1 glutathione peroxidase [Corynebacterium sp. 13CS0277]